MPEPMHRFAPPAARATPGTAARCASLVRRFALLLAPVLLAACATAPALQDARSVPRPQLSPPGHYLAPDALDLARVLPPPPPDGSAAQRAELDEMLAIQAARTPAQAERARQDAHVSLWRFADALGDPPAFNARRLPLTDAFFRRLGSEASRCSATAKDVFDRPRPFRAEPRLDPVILKPPSATYPSGHSTWAHTVAIVLADMLPEYRAQIFARAEEYAHNRIVAGVHYPSDVAGGALAGTVIAADLLASPRFDTDEAVAATELRQALGLPPPPSKQRH